MNQPSGSRVQVSLHQRMLSEIRNRILSGEWEPGHRIPFEHELMKQYDCSRMTVSKVLTQLADARMIERRRKSGSFVCRPHSQSAVLTISDIKDEVASFGQPYDFQVLSRIRRRSTSADRELLGLDHVAPVLEVLCLHMAGTQPFCFERRLINLEAVPGAAAESFTRSPPGSWLLHRVPWAMAEHSIRAGEATADIAARLDIKPKSPVLLIERRTRSVESTGITWAKLAYPANMHELVASFSPPGNQDARST